MNIKKDDLYIKIKWNRQQTLENLCKIWGIYRIFFKSYI